jgi:outer membrane protein TolC
MVLAVLLLFMGITGCKQQVFMSESDYAHYRNLMPESLETTAASNLVPDASDVAEPATVINPERKVRYMSLAEAIAIALEQGLAGGGPDFNLGNGPNVDQAITSPGIGSDAIRVLALNPAIAHTDIESALSRFDARWVTSMSWQRNDRPVGTALDEFQAGDLGSIQQSLASFSSSLVKPLPTGGVAGITFGTDYEFTNLNQRVNPAYRPTLTFGFEQPLFQGYGVEINQLRGAHPGSQLFGSNITSRAGSILLARLNFDQTRTQFEFTVDVMLLRVEAAYWDLYGAYWALYAREQALRQAYEAWRINKFRYEAGRIPIQDFAQTRGQYELFRGRRIEALGAVLEAERRLRGVLNLPVEDGTRVVPVDTPTVAPYTPDWQTALNESMALFPSLILARQQVKSSQLVLITQKNLLLPDVRFTSTYEINAIGSQLDGDTSRNAFKNLRQADFQNWTLGLRAEIPIGYRDAHAATRQARLQLAQSYLQLRDQETRVQRYLAQVYRNVFELHERIKASRAEREAFAEQLAARFKEFLAGRGTLDFLLESQRNWAEALEREYANIVDYNQTLGAFQYAKGTMLQYYNVVISEGPLPEVAQVRAVEHQRERSAALLLREHDEAIPYPLQPVPGLAENPQLALPSDLNSVSLLPALPQEGAPSVPALLKNAPPVPDIRESMPREASGYLQKVKQQTKPAVPATGQPEEVDAPVPGPVTLEEALKASTAGKR